MAAGLFGDEMDDAILSGEVRVDGSDGDRRLVLYVSDLSRQPLARVVVDLFDDTWMMTSAKLCVVHEAGSERP